MENTKKKRKIKVITAIALVMAVGCSFTFYFNRSGRDASAATQAIQTRALTKGTLMSTLSASGTIASDNSQNIYSGLTTYPIQEVYVDVGDEVKAGDVLAVLDLDSVTYDIKKGEVSLKSAQTSLTSEQQSLNNSITNAELSLESATLSLETQILNYEQQKEQLEKRESSELVSAQNSIDSAKRSVESTETDLNNVQRNYNTNKSLYDAGLITKSELDSLEESLENAQFTYNTALEEYQKALDHYDLTLKTLEENLEKAEKDVESAQLNYKTAQKSLQQAKEQTSTAGTSVESQRISLEELYEELDKALVTTPIDGTVTSVTAVVGMKPEEIMFVIEDMTDLYVSTDIDEYAIGDIAVGQQVLISTEATDAILAGEVIYISPTASSNTTTVTFETKVKILDQDPELRIGMNATMTIVLETREDVYSVPFDAVTTNSQRQEIIYAVENGVFIEVPVQTGLENDTSVEISGDGLYEGLQVVMKAGGITAGQPADEAVQIDNTARGNTGFNGGEEFSENRGNEAVPDGENRTPLGQETNQDGGFPEAPGGMDESGSNGFGEERPGGPGIE